MVWMGIDILKETMAHNVLSDDIPLIIFDQKLYQTRHDVKYILLPGGQYSYFAI